jgi:hypothetical protein
MRNLVLTFGNSKDNLLNERNRVPQLPMLQEQTQCASLLYHWILQQTSTESQIKLNIRDFQAWSAELRDTPYPDSEIFAAFSYLNKLQLINISQTEITIQNPHPEKIQNKARQLKTSRWLQPFSRTTGLILFLSIVGIGVVRWIPIEYLASLPQATPQSYGMPNPWSPLERK